MTVPHVWLLEKVVSDCVRCPHFRQCGQFAMVAPIEPMRDADADDQPASMPGHA